MLVFAHRSTISTTSTPQYHYQCAAGRLVIWNVVSVGGMPKCQCVRHACLVTWPETLVIIMQLGGVFFSVVLKLTVLVIERILMIDNLWSFSLKTMIAMSLCTFLFFVPVREEKTLRSFSCFRSSFFFFFFKT